MDQIKHLLKKNFELEKYMGKWYEITSFPTWFQKNCKNITATYKIDGDHVKVINRCYKNGKLNKIIGKAFLTGDPFKLKVQFYWPFKSDYIIEYLDVTYSYVIVGSKNKNYLWILSRTKDIAVEISNKLLLIAKRKGYDITKLPVK